MEVNNRQLRSASVKSILASVILLFTSAAYAQTACQQWVYKGKFPQPYQEAQTILCKKDYVIGYSQSRKAPLWVAHKLQPDRIAITAEASNLRPSFRQDPKIPADRQPSNADFYRTGFERGHLVPFEDLSFDSVSARESMFYTNVVPQNGNNNRGIWASLERLTRSAAKSGELYVVSGPIYSPEPRTIGKRIPIPAKMFKMIIDPRKKTVTTYVIPNEAVPSTTLPKYILNRVRVQNETRIDLTPGSSLTDSGTAP